MINSVYRRKTFHNTLEILSRHTAVETFERVNSRARLANRLNRLTGRPATLLAFEPGRLQILGVGSRDSGVREIPVKSIQGSLSQAEEYDRQFRPLNPGLRSRWVKVFILRDSIGWKPIVVHKIGETYYVEDGHHRVSVARQSGLEYIEARVIEYPQGE